MDFYEEVRIGIENEGFDYYLRSYTSPDILSKLLGSPCPDDLRSAWEAYEAAAKVIERLIGHDD